MQTKPGEEVAYHEAGHCVAYFYHRIIIERVTIQSTDAYGHTMPVPLSESEKRDRKKVEPRIICCYAGPATHAKYRNVDIDHEDIKEGMFKDSNNAGDLVYGLGLTNEELKTHLKNEAIKQVNTVQWWNLIKAFVPVLLERKEIAQEGETNSILSALHERM